MTTPAGALEAVLLDPHPIWLDAVELVLRRVGVSVVGKTTSGTRALRLIEERAPDLLTLEVDSRPGEPGGLDVLRQARGVAPGLRAIVLSSHHDTAHIDRSLAAGAFAYLFKTAQPEAVASAVQKAFDVSALIPSVGQAPSAEELGRREKPGGLTRRELEILRLVAEGYSNAALARMLWVTEQTVKFHLSNVYRKLGVNNRTEASRWAQVNGLLSGVTAPLA